MDDTIRSTRRATLDATGDDTSTGSPATTSSADELVDDELLVEEISIDGMCGVY